MLICRKCHLFVPFIVLLGARLASAQQIYSLQISNFDSHDHALSDLVVYFYNGGQLLTAKTVLAAGNASDDITIPTNGAHIFQIPEDPDVTIGSVVMSESVNGSESESEHFNAKVLVPKKISYMQNQSGTNALYVAVDDLVDPPSDPPDQSFYTFSNGTSSSLPGWFVGTSLDSDSGTVSNGFSGIGEVFNSPFTMTVLPEPAGVAALLLGPVLLRRRRR